MFNKHPEERVYRAYLVRLWPTYGDGQTVWRASIEDAHTGERRAFPDIFYLITFLEK